MKQSILIFILLFSLTNTFGQKTELSGAMNSGAFSFSGVSAWASTSINWDDLTNSGYTNGVYGSKSAFCYGISFNVKRATKRNFLFGIDMGYETLRSRISIDRIDGYTGFSTYQFTASGKTILSSDFLNINPYLGYRINMGKVSFDLTAGYEVGYCLDAREKGDATASNSLKYSVSGERETIKVDIRPGVKFSARYRKFDLYAGYSKGIINYEMWDKGDGRWESYSRIIRFGITYQIN
jgi:hypothetical protein